MNRLTARNKRFPKEAYYPYCFQNDTCDGQGPSDKCDKCPLPYHICETLADYEDTGLTPAEIMELKERDTEKKILPITYKPLLEAGWRYECPNCGCAVGENIYHPDVTKDYEYCSMCGQKLEG